MDHQQPPQGTQTRYLTVSEAAERLKCSTDQVYTMVGRGLPHRRLGPGRKARLLIVEHLIDPWLADQTMGTDAPEPPEAA